MEFPYARGVSGQLLRYLLCLYLLDSASSATVQDLVAAVERSGYVIAGRASKTLSDALRWEMRRGRVVRVARGVYRTGVVPRSTVWWMRKRVASLHPDVVAPTLAES